VPGAIEGGQDASVACDHYRRRDADVQLLEHIGIDSYRFSIAWPRIQPSGAGPPNVAGLAFYDRLIDALLEHGIRPFPTLYHWDLPQALEDRGGWADRDTASRFGEYAGHVARAIGDRVRIIALFNEPFIFTSRGYLLGRYAPGRRSPTDYLKTVHVVTMAHVQGQQAVRAACPHMEIGSVFAMAPCEPATSRPEDVEAAAYADAVFNRLFIEPLMFGEYPEPFLRSIPHGALGRRPGDDMAMRARLDFIGVNCYYRLVVTAGGHERPDLPWFLFDVRSDDVRGTGGHADLSTPPPPTRIENAFGRAVGPRTAMGWEIWPGALRDVLLTLHARYPGVPVEVCESGCAFDEVPARDGVVHDERRIAYHSAHIHAVAEARDAGANVRSYHAWSLYDNFEWASGYRPRFGLVHVDFATQRRTMKHSGRWYRALCHTARARRSA
jgi:beta-glucosidase